MRPTLVGNSEDTALHRGSRCWVDRQPVVCGGTINGIVCRCRVIPDSTYSRYPAVSGSPVNLQGKAACHALRRIFFANCEELFSCLFSGFLVMSNSLTHVLSQALRQGRAIIGSYYCRGTMRPTRTAGPRPDPVAAEGAPWQSLRCIKK